VDFRDQQSRQKQTVAYDKLETTVAVERLLAGHGDEECAVQTMTAHKIQEDD